MGVFYVHAWEGAWVCSVHQVEEGQTPAPEGQAVVQAMAGQKVIYRSGAAMSSVSAERLSAASYS
jgi:hypothetical protein